MNINDVRTRTNRNQVDRHLVENRRSIFRYCHVCAATLLALEPIHFSNRRPRWSESAIEVKFRQQKQLGLWQCTTGAATVEFAIIMPILLLFILGIINFSSMFYDKALITNASREAARAGIVLTKPKPTAASLQRIATQNSLGLISFGSTAGVNVLVTGAGGPSGQPLTVKVSYNFRGIMQNTTTVSASTTMINE